MIRHLLKLVWHRKRANALVMAEIFFSFLIVFAVMTLAMSLVSRWGAPLGFSWRDVWVMDISASLKAEDSGFRASPQTAEEESRAKKLTAVTEKLLAEVRSFPQVEAAAAEAMTPYMDRVWETVLNVRGRRVMVAADKAGDDFDRVMQLKVLKGRWFGREDDGQSYVPIVIDENAAVAMFGSADPIGQKFTDEHFGENNGPRELRVVGVIAPYRQNGEFSSNDVKMMFFRSTAADAWDPAATQIVMRVRPGTPASFEAELNRRLHSDSSDVTFRIKRMEELRGASLRTRIVPVVILGIVAIFLMSMVALGLTGVLWQSVTRRMREIGLRRALGASGSGVRWQVLGEVAVLATFAMTLGTIVVLQLPLLGITRMVSSGEFAAGLATALGVIYTITLLCGAYPGWLASKVDPAEALRYE